MPLGQWSLCNANLRQTATRVLERFEHLEPHGNRAVGTLRILKSEHCSAQTMARLECQEAKSEKLIS